MLNKNRKELHVYIQTYVRVNISKIGLLIVLLSYIKECLECSNKHKLYYTWKLLKNVSVAWMRFTSRLNAVVLFKTLKTIANMM